MRRWLPIALLLALAGLAGPLGANLRQDLPAAPVQARSTGQLTVRVIGKASRAPVAGIRVSLPSDMWVGVVATKHENVERARGDLTHDPITGEDGIVVFELPKWFNGHVAARGETGAGFLKEQLVPEGARREVVLELAQGDDAHVVGRVTGPEYDVPVPNARIRVYEVRDDGTPAPSWTPREIRSGPDGSFEFDYPSWTNIYMRIDAEGCSPGIATPSDRLTSEKALSIVRLEYPAAIDAHVVGTSGRGVADVEVRATVNAWELSIATDQAQGKLVQRMFQMPALEWTCKTDATGRARLSGLPRARLKLELRQGGHVVRDEPGLYRVPYQDSLALEFRLGDRTQVSGLVLDQAGEPVGDAEIWLERWDDEHGRFPHDHPQRTTDVGAKTDDAGRFVLPAVLPGKWWIGPAPAHWDTTPVPPTDCPAPPKEISTDLAPGSEVLETNGEASRELTLHVARGLYVQGLLLDAGGRPLPKCAVGATDALNLFGRGAETGPDGRFVLGPVPDLPLYLHAHRTQEHAPTNRVEVRPGDPEVTLREQPSSCIRALVIDERSGKGSFSTIFLRVLESAPEGKRTSGAPVASEDWGNDNNAYSNREGHFSQRFVQPGRFAIGAASEDGRFGFVSGIDAPAGGTSEEPVIMLKLGGKLRVQYRGKETGRHVQVSIEGIPLSHRWWMRHDVWNDLPAPAGTFQLEIRNEYDGTPRLKAIELKRGETRDIVLTDED